MNPIAQQLTVWAATGIITALGGYMLGWWRGYRRKSDAIRPQEGLALAGHPGGGCFICPPTT